MGTHSECSHRILNVPTSILLVITRARRKEPRGAWAELAVRREDYYVEDCCVVFVRLVCHSARHQTRPGLERLVYHPKYPDRHGIPPRCGILHMAHSMRYSERVHLGLKLAHPAHSHVRATVRAWV
jgi:hypothetical protein